MEDLKGQVMSYLKKTLQNDKLTLHIDLVELTEEHKAVSSGEKARLMKKKNPAFNQFIKELGLEPL